MAPSRTVRRAASLAAFLILPLAAAAWPRAALAGYVCELYATVPNEPGGDAPKEVYWTDSEDPGAAERACLVLYDGGEWLSWYLREAPTESFPAAWKRSDLLVKAFPN